jgi:riboflavin biosynthesis pyrimidine reductase
MRQLLPDPGRSLDRRVDLEAAYANPATAAVRANFVLSLDAAVALDGRSGGLGGPADVEVFATLRALTDVVLVGAATVRAEDYRPARVAAEAMERRRVRGQAPIPPIAVVTRAADLDVTARFFSREPVGGEVPPRPLILTCEAAPADRRAALARVAEVVVCGDDSVDEEVALAALRGRGLAHVLCEGGPTLLASLAGAGLVDELCLTHSPVLAGPGSRYLLGNPAAPAWDGPRWWSLAFLAEGDGLLFTRYQARAHPPEAPAA